MIVLFDTNVWISSLHFSQGLSTPRKAIQLAAERDVLATCDEIEEEIYRVLTIRFDWPPEQVRQSLRLTFANSIRVTLQHAVKACRDPKDDMFLECAQLANADLIIAGDKDLLVLERFGKTRIVTPAQYLLEG